MSSDGATMSLPMAETSKPAEPAEPVAATPAAAAEGSEAAQPAESDAASNNNKRPRSDSAAGGAVSSSDRGRGSKRGRGGRGGWSRGGQRERGGDAQAADNDPLAAPSAPQPSAPLTPIQQQFTAFAAYLDQRNDRRETIYQSSRDLTRASKKLISALQRCTYAHDKPAERDSILASARAGMKDLQLQLAALIEGFKPDEYHRFAGAFSPGFQEFIESASFLHWLETEQLLSHAQLEAELEAAAGRHITVPLSDYVVGILDLGGELMRYATNSVTSGNRPIVGRICNFLREVYAAYQRLSVSSGFGGPYRELSKKMEVWMQSTMKIEALCYKLHIRGAEISDSRLLSTLLMTELAAGEQRDERDD